VALDKHDFVYDEGPGAETFSKWCYWGPYGFTWFITPSSICLGGSRFHLLFMKQQVMRFI